MRFSHKIFGGKAYEDHYVREAMFVNLFVSYYKKNFVKIWY
jgi:hypothetical protein